MPKRRSSSFDSPPSAGLRRTLGLWQVSLSGVGVILGAGVYALIGPAAARAGDALWLSFLLAGLTAAVTAYAYARLGRLAPRTSPEFQYTSLAFGPRVGAVAACLMLIANVLAGATVAIGFGGYLHHLAGTPTVVNALGLLVALGAVLYRGIAGSIAAVVALTVVEAAGLVFIAVIGIPRWTARDYLAMPHGVDGVATGAALIFFAYLGFDQLGNLAEEMHEPVRDLPRALFVAVLVSTVLYVLVALSAVGVAGSAALAASSAPLALVARQALGGWAELAVTVVALGATTNTVLLALVSAPRSVYGMAVARVLPSWLARLNAAAIPSVATGVVLTVTAAAIVAGDLTRVAALADAAVLAAFMFVNASLVWLAVRGQSRSAGLRRLADGLLAALGLLLCAGLLARTHG